MTNKTCTQPGQVNRPAADASVTAVSARTAANSALRFHRRSTWAEAGSR
jgi:hypothetical protein